jgi:hypothetical protein
MWFGRPSRKFDNVANVADLHLETLDRKIGMSLVESRFDDFIRFVARGLFTAQQRKRIKVSLVRIAEMPSRLMGLQRVLDDQRAEIDRMKSRVVVLDGKLNLAMFGLPVLDDYRPYLISNSLLKQLDEKGGERQVLAEQDRLLTEVLNVNDRTLCGLAELENFAPTEALIVGLDRPTIVSTLSATFPSLENAVVCDLNPLLLERLPERSSPELEKAMLPIECFQTDPLTLLISQGRRKFDLIVVFHRLHQMSPREQLHFLLMACDSLRPRGVLYIEIPDPSDAGTYWADYRNLRPFSLSMVKTILADRMANLTVTVVGDDEVVRHWGLTSRRQ